MWWILCSRKLKNGRCGVLRLTGIQTNARNSSNAMQAEQRKEQRRHILEMKKKKSLEKLKIKRKILSLLLDRLWITPSNQTKMYLQTIDKTCFWSLMFFLLKFSLCMMVKFSVIFIRNHGKFLRKFFFIYLFEVHLFHLKLYEADSSYSDSQSTRLGTSLTQSQVGT